MATDIYEKTQEPTQKKDYPFGISLTMALIILAIVVIPIIYVVHYYYQFRTYIDDITDSFLYGEKNRTLSVTYENETYLLPENKANDLYRLIVTAGAGKVQRTVPDTEAYFLDFGDGTFMIICPVEITEEARDRDEGILISYTNANGKIYTYDTDQLLFSTIQQTIKKP